jgi:hypothetical protein
VSVWDGLFVPDEDELPDDEDELPDDEVEPDAPVLA